MFGRYADGSRLAADGWRSPWQSVPFGPHPMLQQQQQAEEAAAAAANPAAPSTGTAAAAWAARDKMLSDMRDGLRHLYLFTWLERDSEPPPEVRIADLWLE